MEDAASLKDKWRYESKNGTIVRALSAAHIRASFLCILSIYSSKKLYFLAIWQYWLEQFENHVIMRLTLRVNHGSL